MEFSIKNTNPEKLAADCIIVGVFEGGKPQIGQLSDAAKIIDAASNKAIATVLKSGDMDGKLCATLVLHGLNGIAAPRVMLLGLGKQEEYSEKNYRQAVRAAVKALPKGVTNAGFLLNEIDIKKTNTQTKVAQLTEVVLDATYQVNAVKQKKAEPISLVKITIVVDKAENAAAEVGLKHGLAIGAGVQLAKDLGNLPPNICTPTYLAISAKLLSNCV